MASKTPGGGGGLGRGSSGSGGGGGGKPKPKPITDIKTKKPLTAAQEKKRIADAKKAAAAKAAKIPADRTQYGPVQKFGMNPPKAKAPAKPLGLTTRGKVVATAGTLAAAAGTNKGMKKAGEMNAARIRRNKSKSVPVPRNPRKQ